MAVVSDCVNWTMKNVLDSTEPNPTEQPVKWSATETDYRNRINAAMLFIQANASQPLDVQAIAAAANFSPFHFHRIFVAYVGETVGEYVKRVRMIKAAALLASQRSITEIASEAGYETTSAFIQVFKKVYGVTPQSFKQTKLHTPVSYPMRTLPTSSTRPAVPVQFRQLPSFTVYYVRKQGVVNENYTQIAGEAFDILFRFLDKYDLREQITQQLGIIHDLTLVSPENHRFDAGVVLREPLTLTLTEEVKQCRIEPGKWAIFLHKGEYTTLWQTWMWIYQYWYPTSGAELREASPFEVYLNNKRTTLPNDLLTEIHIPIR